MLKAFWNDQTKICFVNHFNEFVSKIFQEQVGKALFKRGIKRYTATCRRLGVCRVPASRRSMLCDLVDGMHPLLPSYLDPFHWNGPILETGQRGRFHNHFSHFLLLEILYKLVFSRLPRHVATPCATTQSAVHPLSFSPNERIWNEHNDTLFVYPDKHRTISNRSHRERCESQITQKVLTSNFAHFLRYLFCTLHFCDELQWLPFFFLFYGWHYVSFQHHFVLSTFMRTYYFQNVFFTTILCFMYLLTFVQCPTYLEKGGIYFLYIQLSCPFGCVAFMSIKSSLGWFLLPLATLFSHASLNSKASHQSRTSFTLAEQAYVGPSILMAFSSSQQWFILSTTSVHFYAPL